MMWVALSLMALCFSIMFGIGIHCVVKTFIIEGGQSHG